MKWSVCVCMYVPKLFKDARQALLPFCVNMRGGVRVALASIRARAIIGSIIIDKQGTTWTFTRIRTGTNKEDNESYQSYDLFPITTHLASTTNREPRRTFVPRSGKRDRMKRLPLCTISWKVTIGLNKYLGIACVLWMPLLGPQTFPSGYHTHVADFFA